MKKVLAAVLAFVLLFGAVCVSAEEKTEIRIDDALSVGLVIPEGYEIYSMVESGVLVASIESGDGSEDKVNMQLLIAPDEEYATLERLNDMPQEELDAYGLSCVEDLNQPTVRLDQTEAGTYVFVIDENEAEYDAVEILCIYKGYDIVLYMDYPDGRTVSEEDVRTGIKLFSDMSFLQA